MITISNKSTSLADVLSVRERLADFCPAQTSLRCAARANLHQQPTSIPRFVGQHIEKVRPSCVLNRLAQTCSREPFDIQVFNGNQPVIIDNLPRFFVMKVAPLVADVIVPALEQKCGLTTAIRTLRPPRYSPLQSSELGLCVAEPSGVRNSLTATQRSKGTQPDIDPDSVHIKRQRTCFAFDREKRKPSAGFTFDGQNFYCAFKWAVDFYFYQPDLREANPLTVQGIADLPEGQAVVPSHRTKAWVASLLMSSHSLKERLKRKVNSPQNIMQDLGVNFLDIGPYFSNFSDLEILIKPGDMFSLQPPSIAPFLKRGVVEFCANFKMPIQDNFLRFSWIDAIAKRLDHGAHFITSTSPEGTFI